MGEFDAVLDSVHPEAVLAWMYRQEDGQWWVDVRWPYTEDIAYDCQTYLSAFATGPTRIDALRAAVAVAKERKP